MQEGVVYVFEDLGCERDSWKESTQLSRALNNRFGLG